jgi:gliding motility-associated-like protein
MRFADFYKGSSFQWFKNGKPLAGEVNTTLITSSSTYGAGFYQCRVQNDSVCLGSDSFHVAWQPQPPEFIGGGSPDTSLCIGDTLHLNAFTDPSISIRWSNGSILPEQTITQSGAYAVTLSNACDTVTATKNVLFSDCPSDFFVPSAFTPNHDGLNDVFRARYRNQPVNFRLTIYNRFGQRLFFSTDPDKGWNGELNSIQQAPGAYVWLIDYTAHDGSTHHLSGTVTLIR